MLEVYATPFSVHHTMQPFKSITIKLCCPPPPPPPIELTKSLMNACLSSAWNSTPTRQLHMYVVSVKHTNREFKEIMRFFDIWKYPANIRNLFCIWFVLKVFIYLKFCFYKTSWFVDRLTDADKSLGDKVALIKHRTIILIRNRAK